MRRLAIAALALTLVTAAGTTAPAADATIDGLGLGKYWFGPDITNGDLLGKVVLVEMWGS